MSPSEYLGLIAGTLQLIAYLVYIRYFLQDAIRPNAASWVMFAYGTAFIAYLEWESGAKWDVLFLPVVCAVMSLFVAGICVKSGVTAAPSGIERGSFAADLALTVGFLGLRTTPLSGPLFNVGFILASNLTAVTAFVPILWSTWKYPDNEKVAPWLFWTAAYGFLLLSTALSSGSSMSSLFIYPILSIAMHGAMAIIILRVPKRVEVTMQNIDNVYVGTSAIAGKGIFATKAFETDKPVIVLQGPRIMRPGTPEEGPNWVGIGKNEWIDPDYPVVYLNHSCEPNAAFSEGLILRALRPIARDEEITMDYSTTEADLTWRMECECGTPSCRKTLTSIQTAFINTTQPPPALPAMQEIWRDYQSLMATDAAQKQSASKPDRVDELA